jgi:dTDP-4-dehydrorhamnose 3,5-epimerase
MKIEQTAIRDCFVITPELHEDERGFFMEAFRASWLESVGIHEAFVQHNHSHTKEKNTIRGLHFQWDPPMGKFARITRGSAFLVAVDLRKGSPTLGKWFGVEASEENRKQLYTPGSFARGIQTLTDDCDMQYLCSAYYDGKKEGQLRWDDPDVAIDWPIKDNPLVSDKDRSAPTLKEWLARPEADFFSYI